MKNLKFKNTSKDIFKTDEITGNNGVYKAVIDERDFKGEIYELQNNMFKVVYHFENSNLDTIKKNLKKQLETLGVKFEKQIRSKK